MMEWLESQLCEPFDKNGLNEYSGIGLTNDPFILNYPLVTWFVVAR